MENVDLWSQLAAEPDWRQPGLPSFTSPFVYRRGGRNHDGSDQAMTDHASIFRVAAPFLTGVPIRHLTRRIGGTAVSAPVQSATLRILFGSIVLMGSLLISSTPDPQGWPASREPFFLSGMLFLAFVPLAAAGAAWMILRRVTTEDPYERRILGALELLLICYIGSAISLTPNVLPPSIAIFLNASASETQVLLPIGMMFLLPTLTVYSACGYWIFFRSGDGGRRH
jgi:cytochrome bd-type quinol oxidase subunit 2